MSKTISGNTIVYVSQTAGGMPGARNSMGQVIAEYEAAGSAGEPLQKTVYGKYVDEPLMLITVDPSTGDETNHHYHQNRLYTITGLTDASGNVAERYAYTPYGQQTVLDPSGGTRGTTTLYPTENPRGHQGLTHDHETNLIYNRARMLDPRLGRFLQRDPLGYVDGASLYKYLNSSPYAYADPTGRGAWDSIDLLSSIFKKRPSRYPYSWEDAVDDMVLDRESQSMVSHYFKGEGEDFHLPPSAAFKVKRHSGLRKWASEYENAVINKASRERFSLTCDNNKTTKFYNSKTNQDFESIVFALGNVDILVSVKCEISVGDCVCNPEDGEMYPQSYGLECNFKYEFDEKFSDPFDLLDLVEGDIEAGGNPFDVTHEWNSSKNQWGRMPVPF